MVKVRSFSYSLLQLVAFCGLFWLCNLAVAALHIPIPGSVFGLGILVLLLGVGIVPERAVKAGSAVLLGELLLFFIPPVVSVLKYRALLQADGLVIVACVVLGTLMALVGTALVVDRIYTLEKRMNDKRDQQRHLHDDHHVGEGV
ncbi:CidA/LrgA family protein [Oceanobacter mangrovi]|uniref:CidA/LrgA family protein n=1 Tax=Oceanobacter mangrovi TaxID=2862510 RepID=UPI001C8DFAEA|nr:CidA/LrgA family protein [Oceanobacter mangrovi]